MENINISKLENLSGASLHPGRTRSTFGSDRISNRRHRRLRPKWKDKYPTVPSSQDWSVNFNIIFQDFFRIILHDVRTDVNLLPISFVFLNQDSVVKKKDLQMNRWFPLFTLVVAWVITKRLLNWTFWTCKIILKVFHWSVFCDNDLFIRRFEVQRLGAASPKQLVPAKQTWKYLQFNSKIHTPAQRRSLPV